MRTRRLNSTQSKVYETIKASGTITIKGIQEVLGLADSKGYARISRACLELLEAGYVQRVRPGTYSYLGEPRDLDSLKAQKRMARVIRIRTKRGEPFTVTTLAELSECSRYWAKRYVTFLKKKGLLSRVGFERVPPTNVKAGLYLGIPEKLNANWPVMKRKSKTAWLDEKIMEIRSLALQVSRECDSNRESLEEIVGKLQKAIDVAGEAMAKI